MTDIELIKLLLAVETRSRVAVPPGTIAPGTRVRKSKMREGDAHQVGDLAHTLSFPYGPVDVEGVAVYGYFVGWDEAPDLPVFIRGDAIEVVELQPRVGQC